MSKKDQSHIDLLLSRYGGDPDKYPDDLDPTYERTQHPFETQYNGALCLSSGDISTEEKGDEGIRYISGTASNVDSNRNFSPTIVRGTRGRPGKYHDLMKSEGLIQRATDDIKTGLGAGSWDVVIDAPEGFEEQAERIRSVVEDAIDAMDPDLEELVGQIMQAWGVGFALFEPIFYADGRIKRVAKRRASSVTGWVFDDKYRQLLGVEMARNDNSAYTLADNEIAVARWRPDGLYPEGASQLRPIVVPVKIRRLLEEIEAAVAEKRGGGYISVEGESFAEGEATEIEQSLNHMLATDSPWIILPNGKKLNLVTPQGAVPDFGAAKDYLNKMIAIALGIEYALVGTGDSGSYALASAKNDEAHRRLSSYASLVERFFNSRTSHLPYRGLIPRMVDAMGGPIQGVYPRLVWTPPAEDKDYTQITTMVEKGLINWGRDDEAKLREELGLDPLPAESEMIDEVADPLTLSCNHDHTALRLATEPQVARIEEWIRASENRMGTALRRVGAAHRDAFVQRAEGVTSQTEIMRISDRLENVYRDQYVDAVRGQLMRLVAQGSASTLNELGIIPNMPRIPSDESESFRRYAMPTPEARDVIDATARRIGIHAYNVTNGYLTDRETTETAEGVRERSRPQIPSQSAYASTASQYAAQPFQHGREQVAQRIRNLAEDRGYPTEIIAEYSSVMERGSTCDPCRDADGTRAIVGSNEYSRLSPPNLCDGGGRCRCIWTYIMPNEAGYADMVDDLMGTDWRQGSLNLSQDSAPTEIMEWVLSMIDIT